MPNRLAHETSPYLLQHKDNPVDWYPWGDAAFERARAEDRPVLLSVGYSACHWCHVMEHESFQDEATATEINEGFVAVKVDREERPDVDAIYMDAVQALTGHGGWPMTVFLTPEGRPFFAGTYFPKEDRPGLPSFRRVMAAVREAWTERRPEVVAQADGLTRAVGRALPASDDPPDDAALIAAYRRVALSFDARNGGFGPAPKFPQEPVLEFLLRVGRAPWAGEALTMLETTLEAMARGGIYDHLGGGFARYSTDDVWLVPHFEKMLYNNAQLARIYLRAWQVTGNNVFRTVAVETIEYVLRDLTNEHGGFMAAEDADSEDVEGKFYVFTRDELQRVLVDAGAPATFEAAAARFGVSEAGNFEGSNILHAAASIEEVAARLDLTVDATTRIVDRARQRLLEVRERRVRPGLDDKVITAWNGLMVRTLAEAGAVLGNDHYLAAARRNAGFVRDRLRRPSDGRLLRSWSKGRADIPGYLEDYAGYALGLSVLYEATGEIEWYAAARELTEAIPRLFTDDTGQLFATGSDADRLIVRPRDQMDNPTPSGASMAAEAYLRLGLYTGDATWIDRFEAVTRAGGLLVERAPLAAGHLLSVLASYRLGLKEVAVVGPEAGELAGVVWADYAPQVVLAVDPRGEQAAAVPLLAGRSRPGQTLAYVCERMACLAPVGDAGALRAALGLPESAPG